MESRDVMERESLFVKKMYHLLKEQAGLSDNEIRTYTGIVDQHTRALTGIIDSPWSMEYIPSHGKWKSASNGSIVIGEYRLELCNYGELAINVYRLEELITMVTHGHTNDIFNEIGDINKKIRELDLEREHLLEKLRKNL